MRQWLKSNLGKKIGGNFQWGTSFLLDWFWPSLGSATGSSTRASDWGGNSMNWLYLISGLTALGLLIYLFWALLKPEDLAWTFTAGCRSWFILALFWRWRNPWVLTWPGFLEGKRLSFIDPGHIRAERLRQDQNNDQINHDLQPAVKVHAKSSGFRRAQKR